MKNIYNYTLEDLENYFLNINEKKFKAKQVYDWLYVKRVSTFDEMTNIKKELISKLSIDFNMEFITIKKVQTSETTNKYLFELLDGNYIEAVLMKHDYGDSICVSSQVGCNMGCKFCESGRLKKVRNLETYEIVEQILLVEKDIGKRIFEAYKVSLGHYNNIIGSDYNFVGTSIISYKSETNDKIICHNITIFSGN